MRPALWARLDPPKRVALMQRAWDSHHTAVRMRAQGFLYRQIGARLGLSVERSRQLCSPWAFRRYNKGPSPIEIWLSGPAGPAMEIIDYWRKHASREMPRMTIRILPILLLALPLAAHAADMSDCHAYANRGSAAALQALLAYPFIDVSAGRFLYRKAYTFCLNADEIPPLVFTPQEQPIVDGLLEPKPPPASVPATDETKPVEPQGKALCIKHGKRTIYRGKHWRCVK